MPNAADNDHSYLWKVLHLLTLELGAEDDAARTCEEQEFPFESSFANFYQRQARSSSELAILLFLFCGLH